jgi:hypothetical protein
VAKDSAKGFDVFGLSVVLSGVSMAQGMGGDVFIYTGF